MTPLRPRLDNWAGAIYRGSGVLLVLYLQACATGYAVLSKSSYQNPPRERLKVLVMDFKDLTGSYGNFQPKFEDLLTDALKPQSVRIIGNLWQLKNTSPNWHRVNNIFTPVDRQEALPRLAAKDLSSPYMSLGGVSVPDNDKIRGIGSLVGADLLITGTVEELRFGDEPFEMSRYIAFGLIGEAAREGTKVGTISFNINVISMKDGKVIFSKTVEGVAASQGQTRTEVMQEALYNAVGIAVSHLLN